MTKLKIPQNKSAEDIILGCCLFSIDALNEAVEVLENKDFYDANNGIVFAACKKRFLANQEVDAFSIVNELSSTISSRDATQILNLREFNSSKDVFKESIKLVKNNSKLRSLYEMGLSLSDKALEKGDPAAITQEHIKCISDVITDSDTKVKDFDHVLENFEGDTSFKTYLTDKMQRVARGESPYHGIQTHYKLLDETIGAFRNGSLHYVGARTSMGKTTFLLNLVNNIITHDHNIPVAFFSLEMMATSIATKLLCMKAAVPYWKYSNTSLSQEEADRLFEAQRLFKGNLIFEDSRMDIATLSARARRLVKADGVKIIFIDYLTCIKEKTPFGSKHLEVDHVSKGLLALAKELAIPIVCLAQLNRGLTNRTDKTPTLADFRESGSIEEDADVCILLDRPQYHDQTNPDPNTYAIVAKNRLTDTLKRIPFEYKKDRSGIYNELSTIEDVVKSAVTRNGDAQEETNWKPATF